MTRSDDRLAHDLATRAGELLLELRDETGFDNPSALRAAGDKSSHDLLVALLAEARPLDAVLSEEGSDDRSRLGVDRVWIVDPLDGTNEYGEPGRTDWAVHVALWERAAMLADPATGGLTCGAVALPARGITLSTALPLPSRPPAPASPRLCVSRSRPPAWIGAIAERVGGEIMPLGSAGMKAMAVVLGEADAYLHRGPMKEWDSAAPVVVARAAGLHVGRFDGAPLTYNTPDRLTTELVVCDPAIAGRILAAASAA